MLALVACLAGCGSRITTGADDDGGFEPRLDVGGLRPDMGGPATPPFPNCSAVTRESAYCLVLRGAQHLALLGLDSGTLCDGPTIDADLRFASSMAWVGDSAYICEHDQVIEVDLATGATAAINASCWSLTDQQGGFLILQIAQDSSVSLSWYGTAGDLAQHKGKTYAAGSGFSSVAAHRDTAVLADSFAREVTLLELGADPKTAKTLRLEGGERWILAMDATESLLVIADTDYFRLFDRSTGKLLRSFPLPYSNSIGAMNCVSGAPR